MKNLIYLTILILATISYTGCDSFLTSSVDQAKLADDGINNADDLQKAVNGAFNALASGAYYGSGYPLTVEVISDNAYSNQHSGRYINEDKVEFTSSYGGIWSTAYRGIGILNYAIHSAEKLDDFNTQKVKDIIGQAYALRALIHMDLLMVYGQQYVDDGTTPGGIPYITSYGELIYPARLTVESSWDSIGVDFQKAVDLLSSGKTQSIDPTYMNYWAARGLQCRYGVYSEQWELVKTACKDVIDNGPYQQFLTAGDYVNAWSTGSGPQSLFEIAFNINSTNGIGFLVLDTTYGDVVPTQGLYDIYTPGDARLDLFTVEGIVIRMTGKYVSERGLENTRVLRFAEVVLNYAEALARTDPNDNSDETKLLINDLASNRNAPTYTEGSVANVLLERRKELAMEGFRLFDLARNHEPIVRNDSRTLLVEDIQPGDYRYALPIPLHETDANENLEQNKGYY